jgi:hypothetical protein
MNTINDLFEQHFPHKTADLEQKIADLQEEIQLAYLRNVIKAIKPKVKNYDTKEEKEYEENNRLYMKGL